MPKFLVNDKRALDAIDNINYSPSEYFNEFIGGLASEAKSKITVDFNLEKELPSLFHRDSIILSGDDGGFSQDNIISFQSTYDSNDYGMGEHGQGVRAAFNNFIKNKANIHDNFYGIISYNEDIGWKIIHIYNGDKERNKGFVIEYEFLPQDDEYISLHKKYIDGYGTLFVIPHLLNREEKDLSIQYYKKLLNYRIFNENLELIIRRNNEINNVYLEYPLVSCHKTEDNDYLKFNIVKVKARPKRKDNKRQSRPLDMFTFDPNPFSGKKEYYNFPTPKPNIYYEDEIEILDNVFEIPCELSNIIKASLFPNHESDYGIRHLSHDVGYWIMKNNVLINMESFGIIKRGEGTGFSPQILYHSDIFIKTEANKSRLKLSNVVMPYNFLLPFIKENYKKYCRTKQDKLKKTLIIQKNYRGYLVRRLIEKKSLVIIPIISEPEPEPEPYCRTNISQSTKMISLLEQYELDCNICLKRLTEKNREESCHIKSAANGGGPEKKNTLIGCFQCNRSMGSKNLVQWIQEMWGVNSDTYNRVLSILRALDKDIY